MPKHWNEEQKELFLQMHADQKENIFRMLDAHLKFKHSPGLTRKSPQEVIDCIEVIEYILIQIHNYNPSGLDDALKYFRSTGRA